uniref:Uncharacterized protein n=1 Tax=Branchiostoma floridae TaxID=7739 RepID=C3YXF5_BRAFL|eukprot:XP_002598752.1 hypothetical protein BRAFLDRAFT_74572 [Branchiostoma floridae]
MAGSVGRPYWAVYYGRWADTCRVERAACPLCQLRHNYGYTGYVAPPPNSFCFSPCPFTFSPGLPLNPRCTSSVPPSFLFTPGVILLFPRPSALPPMAAVNPNFT